MPRVQFTTKLEERIVKEIKKLAIDLDCSVNDIIEDCLRSFLNNRDQQKKIKRDKPKSM